VAPPERHLAGEACGVVVGLCASVDGTRVWRLRQEDRVTLLAARTGAGARSPSVGAANEQGARPGQGWSGGLLQILNSPYPVFLPERVLTRNATTAERQRPSVRLLSPWSHRS
jgi:hypothetical protein